MANKRKLCAGIHILSIAPDATREAIIASLAEFCDEVQYGPFKYIGDELRSLILPNIEADNADIDLFIHQTVKILSAATLRNKSLLTSTILHSLVSGETDEKLIRGVSKLNPRYHLLNVNDLEIFPDCCKRALEFYDKVSE